MYPSQTCSFFSELFILLLLPVLMSRVTKKVICIKTPVHTLETLRLQPPQHEQDQRAVRGYQEQDCRLDRDWDELIYNKLGEKKSNIKV